MRPMEIKRRVDLAKELIDRGELFEADRLLEPIEQAGEFADVLHLQALIFSLRENFEQAEKTLKQALEINPNYTEALLTLAVVYGHLGKDQEAQTLMESLSTRVATSRSKVDDFAKGQIANLHAKTARAYVDVGMNAEAKFEYRKAIILCPTFVDLRLELAQILQAEGDLNAALFELKNSLEYRDDYVPVLVTLGVVSFALGKKKEAESHWRHAQKLEPDNPSIQSYLRMLERN